MKHAKAIKKEARACFQTDAEMSFSPLERGVVNQRDWKQISLPVREAEFCMKAVQNTDLSEFRALHT